MSDPDPLLTAAAVLNLAQRWDARATEVSLLRSGENSTWKVRSGRAGYALRLISKARRTMVQIEGELAFIDHLAAGGVRIARARRTSIGDRVIAVTTQVAGPSYATCFEWLHGRHFEYHSRDTSSRLFRAWGATMARIHYLSSRFILPSGTSRPEWTEDAVASCATTGAAVSPRIIAERDDLVAWLRTTAIEPSQYGLVHGDFERTNFLLYGDRIGVLDLDDCCRHWFAWDIACALWAFRNASPSDRRRYLGWFMEGYGKIREPDAERMRHFSDLVRLRTIALLLYRLRDPARLTPGVGHDWVMRTAEWLRSDWRWE